MSTAGAIAPQRSSARIAASLFAQFAGFAVVLFITRFVARGHLAVQTDQECYIGGIAVDLLAHGVRFPLLAYAPNEYDNGSFFSGILTAVSFSLIGRNVLALKLVTHSISAAGAVATLWLLRGCLAEAGLTQRRVRWVATAALVVAVALAPRVVTLASMHAVGNHAEGAAIDAMLLALFWRRRRNGSVACTASFWALAGFALYLNKGTFLVIPVLGAAEIVLAWTARRHLAAAIAGFGLGALPEWLVIAQRHGIGWRAIAMKADMRAQAFPWAFADSVLTLAEHRVELLVAWGLAIAAGLVLFARSVRRDDGQERSSGQPETLGIVVGVSALHLAALAVMAQGGIDTYTVYGYPTLAVLFALSVGAAFERAARRRSGAAPWAGAVAIALALMVNRPDALTWGIGPVSALWHDRLGAACSWRFAEGFEREQLFGLAPPGRTREQHAIERCRSLSEPAQVLDCIGGIARELHWRRGDGKVEGEPPPALGAEERRAYAYHYGTHRFGDAAPCTDFTSPDLQAECAAAVRLECLAFGDLLTRFESGRGLGRPRCDVSQPPMEGFWTAVRSDLLAREAGAGPHPTLLSEGAGLRGCEAVFEACYGSAHRISSRQGRCAHHSTA